MTADFTEISKSKRTRAKQEKNSPAQKELQT